MKPIPQTFAQLLLRFYIREHVRHHGRKPTRREYFCLRYRADIERRREQAREADRAARRRRWALWLIESVRRAG